ncbi:MAG: hypothetical protein IJ609_01080 [Paludibacteraceae bacterium]|nr:hypothetical protein [Paludibacteraceae bacterium]MBR1480513.1 hypothetical protein [Paludibacteraceae bacterium]
MSVSFVRYPVAISVSFARYPAAMSVSFVRYPAAMSVSFARYPAAMSVSFVRYPAAISEFRMAPAKSFARRRRAGGRPSPDAAIRQQVRGSYRTRLQSYKKYLIFHHFSPQKSYQNTFLQVFNILRSE